MSDFFKSLGDYSTLVAYKKAMCVYDGTVFFTRRFYKAGDRTIGQMEQAARSAKQNIVEGNVDGATSTYSNLHLLNIARGSLAELKEDYEDYLRVNNLKQWALNSEKCNQARRVCAKHNDSGYYVDAFKNRTAETVANIMIVVVMQCLFLTTRLYDSKKVEFKKKGGKKEEMYRVRKKYRDGVSDYYPASEPEVYYGNGEELPY